MEPDATAARRPIFNVQVGSCTVRRQPVRAAWSQSKITGVRIGEERVRESAAHCIAPWWYPRPERAPPGAVGVSASIPRGGRVGARSPTGRGMRGRRAAGGRRGRGGAPPVVGRSGRFHLPRVADKLPMEVGLAVGAGRWRSPCRPHCEDRVGAQRRRRPRRGRPRTASSPRASRSLGVRPSAGDSAELRLDELELASERARWSSSCTGMSCSIEPSAIRVGLMISSTPRWRKSSSFFGLLTRAIVLGTSKWCFAIWQITRLSSSSPVTAATMSARLAAGLAEVLALAAIVRHDDRADLVGDLVRPRRGPSP